MNNGIDYFIKRFDCNVYKFKTIDSRIEGYCIINIIIVVNEKLLLMAKINY